MEACYQTLSTIYEIVKTDPAPQTYLCTPHELILRQTQDWNIIEKHLKALAAEQLVTIKQLDKMAICITEAGINKAKTLKNNFVSKTFTLPVKDEKDISIKH